MNTDLKLGEKVDLSFASATFVGKVVKTFGWGVMVASNAGSFVLRATDEKENGRVVHREVMRRTK